MSDKLEFTGERFLPGVSGEIWGASPDPDRTNGAQGARLARACADFLRSLGPLTAMVLWWSWGEWVGYLTQRHPGSLVVAPEILAAQRGRGTPE